MHLTGIAQETPLKSANFDDYIHEVYLESAETLIYSKPQQLEFKKQLLNRIVIINDVDEIESKYLDLEDVYIIKTYNSNLKASLPQRLDADTFNPFKYKLNIYNQEVVFYYYAKTQQLLKIYPIPSSI